MRPNDRRIEPPFEHGEVGAMMSVLHRQFERHKQEFHIVETHRAVGVFEELPYCLIREVFVVLWHVALMWPA